VTLDQYNISSGPVSGVHLSIRPITDDEYYEYPEPYHVRLHYGVVINRYELVRFHASDVDEWELFDLKDDPNELHNMDSDPAHELEGGPTR
jgi:Domain of unknown function (DUF4976)